MTRPRHPALVVLSLAVVLAGCGVPTSSPPEVVSAVPYDLAQASPAPSPTTRATSPVGLKIWLVRDDALVPVTSSVASTDVSGAAAEAVERLAAGPSDEERNAGLSTALGADVQLSVTEVRDGRATVGIRSEGQTPSAGELPLAVGQVVLTLTSIAGIDDVVLTSDGTPVQAPLPGGVLTERPLDARDYAYLEATSTPAARTP